MAKGKYDKYLKNAQKNYDSAAKGASGFINPNVEPGKQECKLVKAEFREIDNGQKLKVAWVYDFEVDKKLRKKNPEAGYITQLDGLDTEQNMSFLKRRLDMYGYDTDEINLAQDLPQILKELTKKQPTLEVVVKQDDQYQNVWPNRVLDEGEEADEDEEDEESEDEEEEGSDDEDEEAEDEEEEEDPELEKGDKVLYKPPRARKALAFTITKIKNGKADLKDEAGGIHTGILLEKLEKADDDEDEEEEESDDDDDSGDEEEDFAEVKKGSKLEVKDGKKTYKAVAVADPNDKNETVKVKFVNGPKKGKTETVDQSNCELLD